MATAVLQIPGRTGARPPTVMILAHRDVDPRPVCHTERPAPWTRTESRWFAVPVTRRSTEDTTPVYSGPNKPVGRVCVCVCVSQSAVDTNCDDISSSAVVHASLSFAAANAN